MLSPGLIFKGESGYLQDTWVQDFDATTQSAYFATSPTGWTNNELGLAYIDCLFDKETKPKARNGRDWRLLILDGHGSHLNKKFIEKCDSKRILLAFYPPHATHRLQPLDVSLFAPLATYYTQELDQFTFQSQGLSAIQKRDFFRLFWPAYIKAFSTSNIASGWRKTGLNPFDKTVVLGALEVTEEPRPTSQSSSIGSYVSVKDIGRIKKELAGVMEETLDRKLQSFQRLEKAVDRMHATIALLEVDNQGLRQAVFEEKRKRKRNKGLFEEIRAQDDNGAFFFSPTKVESLRAFQAQKEIDIATAKAAKAAQKAEQKAHSLAK